MSVVVEDNVGEEASTDSITENSVAITRQEIYAKKRCVFYWGLVTNNLKVC